MSIRSTRRGPTAGIVLAVLAAGLAVALAPAIAGKPKPKDGVYIKEKGGGFYNGVVATSGRKVTYGEGWVTFKKKNGAECPGLSGKMPIYVEESKPAKVKGGQFTFRGKTFENFKVKIVGKFKDARTLSFTLAAKLKGNKCSGKTKYNKAKFSPAL